jgi:hypothetical protein
MHAGPLYYAITIQVQLQLSSDDQLTIHISYHHGNLESYIADKYFIVLDTDFLDKHLNFKHHLFEEERHNMISCSMLWKTSTKIMAFRTSPLYSAHTLVQLLCTLSIKQVPYKLTHLFSQMYLCVVHYGWNVIGTCMRAANGGLLAKDSFNMWLVTGKRLCKYQNIFKFSV